MIAYGDNERIEPTTVVAGRVWKCLTKIELSTADVPQPLLTNLIIDVGEFSQGILDALILVEGQDSWGTLVQQVHRLLETAGRLFMKPSFSVARECGLILRRVCLLNPPSEIPVRMAEGFAYYSVYPELYERAAADFRESGRFAFGTTIGIRSIGAPLGGLVSAAMGGGFPLATVRPTGHPFLRKLAISAEFENWLMRRKDGHWLIVDEGPGISGSSFGSVAEWLIQRGVSSNRIHFFPGHQAGPSIDTAGWWKEYAQHVVSFEDEFLHGLSQSEMPWREADEILDVSGGVWRHLSSRTLLSTPPLSLTRERRKYIYFSGSNCYFAKFAGLGWRGAESADLATKLGEAGLSPELIEARYGFMVWEWLGEAVPVDVLGRSELIEGLARYLSFRAVCCPPSPRDPVTGAALFLDRMLVNLGEVFGPETIERLESWRALLPELEMTAVLARVDGRLQRWEWLVTPAGKLLKTDAADHWLDHDGLGARDYAWDVAGADIEFELMPAERDHLLSEIVKQTGLTLTIPRLLFWELAYLAYQIAWWDLAERTARDESERQLISFQSTRYRRLAAELVEEQSETRRLGKAV